MLLVKKKIKRLNILSIKQLENILKKIKKNAAKMLCRMKKAVSLQRFKAQVVKLVDTPL